MFSFYYVVDAIYINTKTIDHRPIPPILSFSIGLWSIYLFLFTFIICSNVVIVLKYLI